MIEQTAKVISLESSQDKDNYYAWLEPNTESACHACSSQTTCGTSLIGKIFNHQQRKIRVKNICSANVGDNVIIGMSENTMLLSSLMIYILPLLFLIGFGGLAVFYSSLANLTHSSQDLLILFSMIFAFFVSYLVLKSIRGTSNSSFYDIKLLRIK
ncbi:MAG: SoxR reducing system RseC family protein [Gammaproteobacteria bacterium]|nr:SoxR reducing system RseC family protein [Gammaproteobacteria bacterium]